MNHLNLEHRLHQREHRSGAMIGVSMLAAMALGIVAFVVIYSFIDPLTTDFVSKGGAVSRRTTLDVQPTANTVDLVSAGPTAVPEIALLGNQETTGQESVFQPDYRVSAALRINLRSGPGTDSDVMAILPPGSELEYLDEEQVTSNPQRDRLPRGGRWLKFRTEQGDEGWIREIDVAPASR
jgi:hypothetical protein